MGQRVAGRLLRQVTVRFLDFSLSGCLVATDQPIESGTVGELRVDLGGRKYQDTVHVVRTATHHGSRHVYTLGGQFAWGTRPGAASVRGEVPSIVPTPK